MKQVPNRIDANSIMWFYEQHRLLWTWVSELSRDEIVRIVAAQPDYAPDYSIKMAWPGWDGRWGTKYGSLACEVGGNDAKRCFKCPLGVDYCQLQGSGYQKFLQSIRDGDLVAFKAAALEIRDAWTKPEVQQVRGWW